MNYIPFLENYRQREIDVYRNLDLESVNVVMNLLKQAKYSKHKIFICGNGGSAATASHFCCDFNKGVGGYNIECLSDNVPTITAIANDIGYEEIFSYQLKDKVSPGDVLIGISGSGNSKNIIKAFDYAIYRSMTTIAFVGYDGGEMKKKALFSIHIPINDMQITEDLHMILDHMMMKALNESKVK